MPRYRLALACVAAATALAPSAHADVSLPHADTWQPWTSLLATDPYRVPEAVGRLRGVTPTSRCGAAGTDLDAALARLGTSASAGLRLPDVTATHLARLVDCLALHTAHLPAYDGELRGEAPMALRAQWLGAMSDLARMAASVPSLPAGIRATCVDVLCLVQLGTAGSDVYTTDAALIVDPGGADEYRNNSAGADPLGYLGIAAALVIDQGTADDRYRPVQTDLYGLPTNGSGGTGGVGVLVDQGGNDHYCGLGGTMGSGFSGAGLLLDVAGTDNYESFDPDANATSCPWNAGSNFGQSHKSDHGGSAYGGFGILVDVAGNDTYTNYGVDSMGWGAAGGTGVLVDVAGSDTYAVYAAQTGCGVGVCAINVSGVSIGTGEVGGVGVLLDGSGNDAYGCHDLVFYGCQGSSAVGVLGLMYDGGGNDSHFLAPSGAAGTLGPVRATGIGTAELGGVGVFVDQSGTDSYTSTSPAAVGYGDAAVGVFLDLGGSADTYSLPLTATVGARGNNAAWVAGVVGVGVDR